MNDRQTHLNAIRQQPDVSVLIVGAGINGIGTFRELALNGVDVLMVDKADFCSGASAASSHMVHGGIRYLENGEFRLVREALTERNRLLKNAPHYVKPLPTTIPVFKWLSGVLNAPLKFLGLRDKPSERGALIIKAGLVMYDIFARAYRTMPTHSMSSRARALKIRPQLNPLIVCTATYYDSWMPVPERICMELIRDAEAASANARAINYVSLAGAAGNEVTLRDEVTGETLTVRPKIVINAAGPWIDLANQAMGQKTRFIGGTKGSHLVVDHPELHAATAGHEIFFENHDGRICLIFPLMDKVLIGTTDIRVDDPNQVQCTDDEVDYMLKLVSAVFPKIQIDRTHIVFRFCGVRPLPASEASRTGAISRDHSIRVIEPGSGITFPVLSLVGGKWTTFRAFSEQTADQVLGRLGKARAAHTGELAIGGGRGYPRSEAEQREWLSRLQQKAGIPAERARTLFERYGTCAEEVAAFMAAGADQALRHLTDYSRREVLFLTEREKVVHLDDFVLRRSLVGMLGHASGGALAELAAVMAEPLRWTAAQAEEEIRRAAHLLNTVHGVSAETLKAAQPQPG